MAALGGAVPGDVVGDLAVADQAKIELGVGRGVINPEGDLELSRLIRLDFGTGKITHAGLVGLDGLLGPPD